MALVIAKLNALNVNVLQDIQILDKKDKILVVTEDSDKGIPFDTFPLYRQLKCEVEFMQQMPGLADDIAFPFMLGYLYATNKENMFLFGFSEEVCKALPTINGNAVTFVRTTKELIKALGKVSLNKDATDKPKRVRRTKIQMETEKDQAEESVSQTEKGTKSYSKLFHELMKEADASNIDTIAECIAKSSDYKYGLPIQMDIRFVSKAEQARILRVLDNGNYEKVKEQLV